MRQPTTCYDQYNFLAGLNGWLPIGIGPHSSKRTMEDAAERIELANKDVAQDLRHLAGLIPSV